MFCYKCGRQISDNSEFCYHCGTRVHAMPNTGNMSATNGNPTPHSNPNQVIARCKPHWTLAWKAILVTMISLIFGFVFPPLFLVAVIAIIYDIIFMYNVDLYMTSEAVIGKIGILNTKRMMSPVGKVQDIQVTEDIWGRILGYGNIIIYTAGTSNAEYAFKHMSNCKSFQEEFIRLQSQR